MPRSFTVIDAPQRSPEWHAARLGRLTGSVAGDMLARTKSGWAASRDNLLVRLVLERMTGKSQERAFTTPAMQDGIDREPDARAAYEAITGQLVTESGFLRHDSLMVGASLDGYMGDFQHLLSIKCRQPKAHLAYLETGKVPADAWAQLLHEMWITGAESHTYFSWNPDFPEAMQARWQTYTRDQFDIKAYEAAALAFLDEVDRKLASIKGWKAAL